MLASTHLAQYGVSVAQAREFIVANLSAPQVIYNTAKQYGVTHEMLAEIYGGVSSNDVRSFFSNLGFDAVALDSKPAPVSAPALIPAPAPTPTLRLPFEEAAKPFFLKLINFNSATGILSDASLRSALIQTVGEADYYSAFNLNAIPEAADGKLTASELNIPNLADITSGEQLESLFFGYLVNFAKSLDSDEMARLEAFSLANSKALLRNDKAATERIEDFYIDIIQDQAPLGMQFHSD
jgi:hypothetical protein